MKKIILLIAAGLFFQFSFAQVDVGGIIKSKVNDRATQKVEQGVDKGLDKGEEGAKKSVQKKDKSEKEEKANSKNAKSKSSDEEGNSSSGSGGNGNSGGSSGSGAASSASSTENVQSNLKAYGNFDFVPGEKILFEDDFKDSQDGEFPPRWNLISGQGNVNTSNGEPAFVCMEGSLGNSNKIEPAMKVPNYLGASFTLEFDLFISGEDESVFVILKDAEGDLSKALVVTNSGDVHVEYFGGELKAQYPADPYHFHGKWHHASIAYKNQQIKYYLDQYRVLVIPKSGFEPVSVMIGLCEKSRIKNVKLAEGGGMNMLGKILTDGRMVTHAIKFDVNKATIKPESMGFLNDLAKWMKENPSVNLAVEGHTDSDGDNAANQKLSEARAGAVKTQLVSMGVESSRLAPKGIGETKPMDTNTTPEGKANNRRVEFVKI